MTRRYCRSCSEPFTAARDYHRVCWACWEAENQPVPAAIVRLVPVVDAETLKAAVGLCRPDVHPPERRERALRVTQALTAALAETRALEQAA